MVDYETIPGEPSFKPLPIFPWLWLGALRMPPSQLRPGSGGNSARADSSSEICGVLLLGLL
ncbi:uncharacterized protein LDX57_005236 [Aspergillus melleus]|uniref:uncharacterized protein n=1 Tax=Aspergillus melleus TaxID=138277 RepID=UPI001E8DF81D|nr:uncharacterized protein LDX57_005236 [Aspergillus melleus]KAH8427523.1 hypothetical protein LDX57_005236 [Aspergillus melleus]